MTNKKKLKNMEKKKKKMRGIFGSQAAIKKLLKRNAKMKLLLDALDGNKIDPKKMKIKY